MEEFGWLLRKQPFQGDWPKVEGWPGALAGLQLALGRRCWRNRQGLQERGFLVAADGGGEMRWPANRASFPGGTVGGSFRGKEKFVRSTF